MIGGQAAPDQAHFRADAPGAAMRCDDWEVVVPELVFEPDERTSW